MEISLLSLELSTTRLNLETLMALVSTRKFLFAYIEHIKLKMDFQNDLIISDLRARQVPYQNQKLNFLHIGDIDISSNCNSQALHPVGFISTTCPGLDRNMIQVSGLSLSELHRPVSNWIRQK